MKRIFLCCALMALATTGVLAQDAAVEERLNKLGGQIEDLLAAQAQTQKQAAELARELASLRAAEETGPNSRDRVFNLRLTGECFLWQRLKPATSCREVVRQVQALLRLHGRPPVDEGASAYIQARQRLPLDRRVQALSRIYSVAGRARLLPSRVGQAFRGRSLWRRPVTEKWHQTGGGQTPDPPARIGSAGASPYRLLNSYG
jgi:hypothetical protein